MGYAGKGGDGADIRLFTKAECDRLGGAWSGNGECLRKDGSGSWSWDCRGLNAVSTGITGPTKGMGVATGGAISPLATLLSGGSAGSGIPSWVMLAGGALAVLYVLRR